VSFLREEAAHRSALHAGHPTRKVLSRDHDLVALAGEAEFARVFGLKIDLKDRPGGDRGRDFVIETVAGRFIVDVKTARNPERWGLLVRKEKLHPKHIYVLAHYSDLTETARLVGWAWGSRIKEFSGAPRDTGRGVVNYQLRAEQLRTIDELKAKALQR